MKVKEMNWDNAGTKAWRFFCPGCEQHHAFIEGRWTFNGDTERPTFTPSLNVSGSDMTEKGKADFKAWHEAGCPPRTEPFDRAPSVCHSFVTDGRIQFLGDCTHKLAGQTVDVPDLED